MVMVLKCPFEVAYAVQARLRMDSMQALLALGSGSQCCVDLGTGESIKD